MIHYVEGDATSPSHSKDKPAIIVHICNDLGRWGAGFVLALSKRWRAPEAEYRTFSRSPEFRLGAVQFVEVHPFIRVANMIAQHGIGQTNGPPIRYDALETSLGQVATYALANGPSSIHMPRIGCGLAGGKWEEVEVIVARTLGQLDVTVYDLPSRIRA